MVQELYEPFWIELYHTLQKHGVRIRDIWTADAAWQGRSGYLNRDRLGDDREFLGEHHLHPNLDNSLG